MRKLLTLVLTALALLFVAPMIATLVACRSFLYHPTRDVARDGGAWKAEHLAVEGGVELVGLVRAPTSSVASTLLVFGGNGSSISGNRWIIDTIDSMDEHGAAVFAYRGYDGSGGSPSEPALKSDARAIVRFLVEQRGFDRSTLVLIGQSLGTGVASYVAAELSKEGTPPRGLVLLSPYTSIARVFDDVVPIIPVGWAVTDSWDTASLVRDIACPVLIVHGDADDLISIEHGRRLTALFGARARLVEVPGAGHNGLFEDLRTTAVIRTMLSDGSVKYGRLWVGERAYLQELLKDGVVGATIVAAGSAPRTYLDQMRVRAPVDAAPNGSEIFAGDNPENVAVANRVWEAMDAHDAAAALASATDDYVYDDYSGPAPLDKAGTEKMVAGFLKAVEGFKIVEKPVQFAAGDDVITEMIEHMTLKGKPIVLRSIDVKRIKNGRVVREWQYANYKELLDQIR